VTEDERQYRDRSYWQHRVDKDLEDHEERIRAIERAVQDNTTIVSAARWVAIIVGGSTLSLIATIIIEKLVD